MRPLRQRMFGNGLHSALVKATALLSKPPDFDGYISNIDGPGIELSTNPDFVVITGGQPVPDFRYQRKTFASVLGQHVAKVC